MTSAVHLKRRVRDRYLRAWKMVKVQDMTKAAAARALDVSSDTVTMALYKVDRAGGPEKFESLWNRRIDIMIRNGCLPGRPLPGLPRRTRGAAWTPEQVYVETMRERDE